MSASSPAPWHEFSDPGRRDAAYRRMLEIEQEERRIETEAKKASAKARENAKRCQKRRMDKVPNRYNYCACGMVGCKECMTNPYHGGKRGMICPYCDTHHRAQCRCGVYNNLQKTA